MSTWFDGRLLRASLALSALATLACGAEMPAREAREAPAPEAPRPEVPPPGEPSPEHEPAGCALGVWTGDGALPFEYLACRTSADCLVVPWGAECENTTTHSRLHADCVALSPVCPSGGEGPSRAQCNADGFCELVLL